MITLWIGMIQCQSLKDEEMKLLPAAVSESLLYGKGIVDLRNFPKVLILFNTFCFIHGRGVIGWQYELSGGSQPKIIWQ